MEDVLFRLFCTQQQRRKINTKANKFHGIQELYNVFEIFRRRPVSITSAPGRDPPCGYVNNVNVYHTL